MAKRAGIVLLIALPAAALGALGVVVAAAQPSASGRVATHFASREVFALVFGVLVAIAAAQVGPRRLLRAAPVLFACALLASLAVFVPGVGVHAAGASRWIHVGPFSGDPAPLLVATTAMLVAAWAAPARAGLVAASSAAERARHALALTAAVAAIATCVAEPDFSAAALTLAAVLAALAGAGVAGRRLMPATAAVVVVLAVLASRFGYVGGRVSGFLAPEADRRGHGFEVLALAHAQAKATPTGVGLGHGTSRHRLSSPGSDYVFAVVTEELGLRGAGAVVGAWLAIGAGAAFAALGARDPHRRAAALGAGAAALAPAALHVAVCRGWVPIIGVSMPLVSYDPAATVAAGAELGLIAAIALSPGGGADDDP
ncbi:MAG TPA: FtsW/RodA/SpoVE family cell cycle protein [Polyangia bacterium]|nr:FtsW/RodA/SpoVE family cell cycle protein [Polyangia bacterium]